MTIQQLRYVITVAESGSISKAARELYTAQPSLTNAIKELENECGVTIFHRTNKGILVSEEGEEFLVYARRVIEQVDLMEAKYMIKP